MLDKFKNLSINIKLGFISFALGFIALCLILVGQSYAIFSGTFTDTNNQVVKLGNLEVVLNEPSTGIDLGLSPLSDVDGLLQEEVYTFSVENKGSANAMYKVLIIDDETSKASYSGTLLSKDIIRVGLEINGEEQGPYKLSELNELLNEKEIKSGKKDTYKLRLWIDEDANIDDISEQQIFLKLKLEAEQYFSDIVINNLDESGANKPELTENMIPVYYDETNSVWKKADSSNTNETYKWYDYNNKMWANAVTISETLKANDITKNKSVSLSGSTVPVKTYTSFTSGGKGIGSANSMTKITVNINTAGTFGFKATVSSEANYDKLTVTVSKNGGSATTVASAISGTNSNTYSDAASVGDTYVITAQYTKDGSVNNNNDNGVLDTFTYPANTNVTYTDSSTAGGTSGQNWTAAGETTSNFSTTKVGSGITYNDSTSKYDLNSPFSTPISSSLVGKYVCPTVTDTACATPYKIVEASNTITKVDEYKIKTVTRNEMINAKAGTEINMNDINTMWVWIPRYTYTYLNTNTPEEIKIKFEKGTESTGTIKCTDNVSGRGTTSQTCTDTTNGSLKAGTSTYTHPAFTFGDKELKGLWVGKFESSATSILKSESTAESTVIIKPNVQTLRYKRLSYFFRDARQMERANNVYGFPQSSSTTFNWNGNLTGDTNNIDIHMMKNTEWGAVTYLYHSKYGRCANGKCEELTINNCNNYITGIGADTVSASSSSATCTTDKNKYNGESGVKASTTGNVYGVYDMSGGSHKYTMGNMVDESNLFNASSASNWSITTYPLSKYYDSYTYNDSNTTYTRGRLGDATVEMAPKGTRGNWYSDSAGFLYSSGPWFMRGGSYGDGTNAGAFSFINITGGASHSYSFRVSLGAQAS